MDKPQNDLLPPNQSDKQPKPPVFGEDEQKLRSAQKLITVASIAAPVSFIIAGIPLSIAGVVCTLIAWKKLKSISSCQKQTIIAVARLKRSCVVAFVVSLLSLILNAIWFVDRYSELLEDIRNGDYDNFLPGHDLTNNSGGSSNSPKGSKTWG